jgi:hypothetical protein
MAGGAVVRGICIIVQILRHMTKLKPVTIFVFQRAGATSIR